MKLVIFGASGLIGGRLSEFFEKKGIDTIKVSRKKSKGFKKINYNSTKSISQILKDKDVIINCIGADVHQSKNYKKAIFLNSTFPKKIYQIANNQHVKLFIYISTYHIYDFRKKKINESTAIIPKDNHTKSKILGEINLKRIKKKKTKLLILRTCNLFGKPKYRNKNSEKLLINSFFKSILKKKYFLIKSKTNDLRYYSSLENYCNFIYKLLKLKKLKFRNKIKIINYTSNKKFTLINIIQYLQKIILKKKQINLKIFFQHEKLDKVKNYNFLSNFQKNNNLINDRFFIKEILNFIK